MNIHESRSRTEGEIQRKVDEAFSDALEIEVLPDNEIWNPNAKMALSFVSRMKDRILNGEDPSSIRFEVPMSALPRGGCSRCRRLSRASASC